MTASFFTLPAHRKRTLLTVCILIASICAGVSAQAKPAENGTERISKKESFTEADEDALVVFKYHHRAGWLLPEFVWSGIDATTHRFMPYDKLVLNRIDVTRSLFGLAGDIAKSSGDGDYLAFRIPAGKHALCELYMTPSNDAYYTTYSLLLNAPAFDFEPGRAHFIGDLSVSTKTIVTMSDNEEGDATIVMESTPVVYLDVRQPRTEETRAERVEDAKAFLQKKHRNVSAPIMFPDVVYLDLTKPADTEMGFEEASDPSQIERGSPELEQAEARRKRSDPVCL